MIATPTPPSMKPRSTAQNVYDLLRSDIVSGVLRSLEPIREMEIAERLGVSRTPVREALLRLSQQGMVDVRPQSGTRVAPVRIEKVRAAQLIREAVEVEVVRRVASTATDEALDALSHLVEDQRIAARRNDERRLFELDEEFHRAIFAAAGVPEVADEIADIKVHLDRLRSIGGNWPRGAETVIAEHATILEALRARDADAATTAMRTHLRAVLPVLESIASTTT